MTYTQEQKEAARRELARRELARRQQTQASPGQEEEDVPYTPPPQRQGLGGIWEDVKDIPGKVLDYGMNVPGKAVESWGQIFNQPGRAFKNLLAGAGETVEAPINLLGAVGPYLESRGITDKIPGFKVPDTGIEHAMGLDEQQPGDELIRQMFMFAPVPKLFGKVPGVKQAGKRINAMGEHGPLSRRAEELEQKHGEATQEHRAATDEFNALKNFLESQPGFESSNPYALERKATEANQKLERLRQEQEAIPEHLRATEEPIAPEKTPLSLVEPVLPGEKLEISQEPIKNAESLLKTNEQKSAELERQFGEDFLKKGYTHDVPIAEKVTQTIEGVKNAKGKREGGLKQEIGAIYDQVENDLKDQHVLIPQTQELEAAQNAARKLLEGSRGFFKTDEEFEAAVQKIAKGDQGAKKGPNDIVPAADVLSNYRTMRHLSQKLRKEAFSSKVASNKDLQADILKKAEEFETNANNLEGILESNDLGTSLDTLKTANKRWREEITPLYKNKTYRQFLNGLGPDNIMKALRGQGEGQEIIRNIIKNDPELLRNIVGQRYATNPAKLHEFDELTHEYTQHMPEVQKFKQEHFASKQGEAQSRMDLERAKHEHQMQREQADIAHRKQTEEAKAKTRAKKEEVHKENQAKQKEHEQRSKHFKTQQEITELEGKSAKLKESADKLTERAKRRDISLKQKLDLESEIKQTRKKLADIEKDIKIRRRLLKGIGYTGATVLLGAPAYQKVKSMFGGE